MTKELNEPYPKDPWDRHYLPTFTINLRAKCREILPHVFPGKGLSTPSQLGQVMSFRIGSCAMVLARKAVYCSEWLVVKCWKSCNKQRVVWVRWWNPSQPKQRFTKVQNGSKRLWNTYFQRSSGSKWMCLFFFLCGIWHWEGEKSVWWV